VILKPLVIGKYAIVAVMDGETCPAEEFIKQGEATTEASREGLITMLLYVAANGLDNTPTGWTHEANKQKKIYEFIKGRLRLFFFKGKDGQIAVCTGGTLKDGKKSDPASVNKASQWREEYMTAFDNGTLSLEPDDEVE
jgi:hypothetical protein